MTNLEGRWDSLFRRVVARRASHDWQAQFIQHLISGAAATASHYGVMWFALQFHSIPVLATTIGFVAGATVRFLFSYFHIFEPEKNVVSAMSRFVLALTLQMLINAGLLALLLSTGLPVWPSQVLTTGLLTIFTFMAYKFWVFK